MRHPKYGTIFPDKFLPGASEDDMLKLTEHVILKALRDWEELASNGVSVRLAVNTPVSALTRLPIATMLRKTVRARTNWPGLIIEVTEDEIVNDMQLASSVADELRAHQCTLAIDDFGAGYSSLARLRQLPFSELKIDRSYVTDCHRDSHNAGLCEVIVELAHRFGLKTVAEGIETHHESHKLRAIGCDIGQGYLFAKPMEKAKFISLLRRRLVQTAEPNPTAAVRGPPRPTASKVTPPFLGAAGRLAAVADVPRIRDLPVIGQSPNIAPATVWEESDNECDPPPRLGNSRTSRNARTAFLQPPEHSFRPSRARPRSRLSPRFGFGPAHRRPAGSDQGSLSGQAQREICARPSGDRGGDQHQLQ